MALSPVVQASQVESVDKETLQNMLNTLGLNRQITVGEFFNKNKHLFTEGISKQIEPMMELYKDQMMPSFEITLLQNSNGEQVPVVRLTGQGQLHTLQFFKDEDKAVRFDNTDLTLIDVENYNLMINKLYYREPRLRKLAGDRISVAEQAVKTQLPSVPTLSFEVWSKFSIQDKAKYIYYLRRLRAESRFILDLDQLQKNRDKTKTSSFNLLQKLFFNRLEAKSKGPTINSLDQGSSVTAANSNACIIAGYISEYDANGSCSKDKIKTNYNTENGFNQIAKKALESCPKGQLACNPYIYGVNAKGDGLCLKVDKSDNFQKATWSGFGCDGLSPLGKPVKFLKDDSQNKKTDRYDQDNYIIQPQDIEAEYKKQLVNEGPDGSYQKNIENFLKNMLKTPDGSPVKFDQEIENSVFEQILKLKQVFDNEISEARAVCIKAAANKKNEKNFYGACDQLQRRFLLVGEFLKKKPGCREGSVFDDSTLKCKCSQSDESVNPGASCKAPAQKSEIAKDSEPKVSDKGQPNSTPPEQVKKCESECKADDASCKKECGAEKKDFFTKNTFDAIWKYAKWPIFAGVGYLGVKYLLPLLYPKKPKRNTAADACLNGVVASCSTQCANKYQGLVNGICQCPACMPGTSLVSASTCSCSNSTVAVIMYTCADNKTQVADQSLCPNIKCPDGVTYVTSLNLCPNAPTLKPSSTSYGQ